MTRRRYVKLLMGRGWSRNMANAIAEEMRNSGKSYREAADFPGPHLFDDAVRAAAISVRQAAQAFQKMGTALAAGVAAFSEAVKIAMKEG